MSEITFRVARLAEHPCVQAAYTVWGYRGGVSPEDILYIAERRGDFVAAVRRTQEHGIVLLRGMYHGTTRNTRSMLRGPSLVRILAPVIPVAEFESSQQSAGLASSIG